MSEVSRTSLCANGSAHACDRDRWRTEMHDRQLHLVHQQGDESILQVLQESASHLAASAALLIDG